MPICLETSSEIDPRQSGLAKFKIYRLPDTYVFRAAGSGTKCRENLLRVQNMCRSANLSLFSICIKCGLKTLVCLFFLWAPHPGTKRKSTPLVPNTCEVVDKLIKSTVQGMYLSVDIDRRNPL